MSASRKMNWSMRAGGRQFHQLQVAQSQSCAGRMVGSSYGRVMIDMEMAAFDTFATSGFYGHAVDGAARS
jgi:hypothetical protein